MRQAHRTAWLTAHLYVHGRVTFPQYHSRFNCTDRTYYRDLQILSEVGVTVKSHRDHGRVDLVSI